MVGRDDTCNLVKERNRVDAMVQGGVDSLFEQLVPHVDRLALHVPIAGTDEWRGQQDDSCLPARRVAGILGVPTFHKDLPNHRTDLGLPFRLAAALAKRVLPKGLQNGGIARERHFRTEGRPLLTDLIRAMLLAHELVLANVEVAQYRLREFREKLGGDDCPCQREEVTHEEELDCVVPTILGKGFVHALARGASWLDRRSRDLFELLFAHGEVQSRILQDAE